MALIKPTASNRVRQALVMGVKDLFKPKDPLGSLLIQGQQGHQIFTLGLRDIAGGVGLEDAIPVGWRFLAGSPSRGQAVAAEVMQPLPDGPPPTMTSVSYGTEISTAIRAALEIEALPQVHKYDYELRALRIPGLLIEAFWLKARAGDDLIVPYLTQARGLEPMRPYQVREFLDVVRPMVDEFLKFDEAPA